jgi:hypothetical protein
MNPLCAECKRQGRTQEANLSHHLEEWRPSFSEYEFWYGPIESLCFTCHAIHHGYQIPKENFERDIDETGWPCDSMHPVYQTDVAKRECE